MSDHLELAINYTVLNEKTKIIWIEKLKFEKKDAKLEVYNMAERKQQIAELKSDISRKKVTRKKNKGKAG